MQRGCGILNIKNRVLNLLMGVFLIVILLNICPSMAFAVDLSNNDMTPQTFSDVVPNQWYYASVKGVYDSNLMNGVDNEKFQPNGNTTLAQVITMAARLYAQYNNETIAIEDSKIWYLPYLKYAESVDLLSDEIRQVEDLDNTKATRAQSAYLFYKVLESKEPTSKKINASTIYDLNEIPQEYKTAVSEMFGRGIITGITQGYFDGDLFVTRAQIATIMNRVINVCERVPYDAKYNNELTNQSGNLQMHNRGTMVYNEDFTYFIVMIDTTENRCDIVQRNNKTGEAKIIYVGNGHLYNLRIEDHTLYFLEQIDGLYYTNDGGYKTLVTEQSFLVAYDLRSRSAKCVYKTDKFEKMFAFERYGDKFYISGNRTGNYNRRIFEVDDRGNEKVLLTLTTDDGTGVDLFVFDNKLYFSYLLKEEQDGEIVYSSKVSTHDLTNGETKVFINHDLKGINFCGGVLYTAEGIGDGKGTVFYKYNLATGTGYDKDKQQIGETQQLNYTIALSVLKGNLYVSSDKANVIYKLMGDGSLSPAFKTNMLPLNFIITNQNECFYEPYWDSIFNTYYSTVNDTHNGIVSYLGVDKNSEASGLKSVAIGKSQSWPSLDNIRITNEYNENKFTWPVHKLGTVSINMLINEGLYEEYKKIPRSDHMINYSYGNRTVTLNDYAFYCNSPDDDAFLYAASNLFKAIQEDCGHNELELAQNAANFVQSIPYVSDKIGTGYDDYPKFPVEYLYDQRGDCEDSSILLASLYKQLGFECVLLHFSGHMAVGVACPGASGTYYEQDGVKYFYIETTGQGWKIGEVPEEVKDLLLVYQVK